MEIMIVFIEEFFDQMRISAQNCYFVFNLHL